jgi:hypothetical protein
MVKIACADANKAKCDHARLSFAAASKTQGRDCALFDPFCPFFRTKPT